MKNKLLLVSLLALFISGITAQIPTGYYNSAQGLTGSALKTALHNIIKNHTVVSYNSLWTHFNTTDKKPNGKVWDIYSDIPNGTPPYQFTFSTNQCGSYSAESDCYNREHSWPQSWFNSETTPSQDLFHIYPTDGYVNNMRSNYSYGDVKIPAWWTSLNGSKIGACADSGASTLTVFEPIDEYKGDLARGYFYMSTRYEGEDATWSSSSATSHSTIMPWQVDVLLKWNQQDPVSTKEIARNNAIYQIQHNRNPFIDHPQWADSIWTMTLTGFDQNISDLTSLVVYPNPAIDQFIISNSGKSDVVATLCIYSMLGQEIQRINDLKLMSGDKSEYHIDCNTWSKGVYNITIIEAQKTKVLRLIKE